MHQSITPAILYLGTPVVLVSTVNENGSYNLAPMSDFGQLTSDAAVQADQPARMSILATEGGAIAERQLGGRNVTGGAGVLDRAVGVVEADQGASREAGGDVAGGGRVSDDAGREWPPPMLKSPF